MINKPVFTAGQTQEFIEVGDFFRYLEGPYALTVRFYKNGAEVVLAEGIKAGYAETFDTGSFDKISITSTNAQTIQFVTRLGNTVQYDAPPTGAVTLSGMQSTFAQAQATVTNASAQLLPANPGRRYLLVQNKDAAGDVYINLTGAAATAANGIKLTPGGSYEAQNMCPNNAITAVGSIASNANIVTVEG